MGKLRLTTVDIVIINSNCSPERRLFFVPWTDIVKPTRNCDEQRNSEIPKPTARVQYTRVIKERLRHRGTGIQWHPHELKNAARFGHEAMNALILRLDNSR